MPRRPGLHRMDENNIIMLERSELEDEGDIC